MMKLKAKKTFVNIGKSKFSGTAVIKGFTAQLIRSGFRRPLHFPQDDINSVGLMLWGRNLEDRIYS